MFSGWWIRPIEIDMITDIDNTPAHSNRFKNCDKSEKVSKNIIYFKNG